MYTVRMVPNSLLGEDLIISNVFEKKTDEQVVVFVKKPSQDNLNFNVASTRLKLVCLRINRVEVATIARIARIARIVRIARILRMQIGRDFAQNSNIMTGDNNCESFVIGALGALISNTREISRCILYVLLCASNKQ